MNQLPHELASRLEETIAAFVDYYSFRRYQRALGNVTLADVLSGRRDEILQRGKEVRKQTADHRRQYNQALNREFVTTAPS